MRRCVLSLSVFANLTSVSQAVRQAKIVGTLPWMFHVQSTGVLSPPMDQLLWYPIPNKPIEGFSGHVSGFFPHAMNLETK